MYSLEVVLSHPQQNPDTITLNIMVNTEFLGWLELYKHSETVHIPMIIMEL